VYFVLLRSATVVVDSESEQETSPPSSCHFRNHTLRCHQLKHYRPPGRSPASCPRAGNLFNRRNPFGSFGHIPAPSRNGIGSARRDKKGKQNARMVVRKQSHPDCSHCLPWRLICATQPFASRASIAYARDMLRAPYPAPHVLTRSILYIPATIM